MPLHERLRTVMHWFKRNLIAEVPATTPETHDMVNRLERVDELIAQTKDRFLEIERQTNEGLSRLARHKKDSK